MKRKSTGTPSTPQPQPNVATRRSARLLRSDTREEVKSPVPVKTPSRPPARRESAKQATPVPPERPYEVIDDIPLTKEDPDYSLLKKPLGMLESNAVVHSMERSRNAWLSGAMFEKFWTRPPRGKKGAAQQVENNTKEKMTKLCECYLAIGPHFFDVKLFVVKDDSPDEKDDPELRRQPQQQQTPNTPMVPKQQTAMGPPQHTTPQQQQSVALTPQSTNSNPAGATQNSAATPQSMASPTSSTPQNSNSGTSSSAQSTPSTTNTGNEESKSAQVTNTIAKQSMEEPKVDKTETSSSAAKSTAASATTTSESAESTAATAAAAATTTTETPESKLPSAQPADSDASTSAATAARAAPVSEPPIPGNQLMIHKLQAIARTDPSLTPLMKVVATGKATNEQIARFQVYISKAKAMENAANRARQVAASPRTPKTPAPKKPKATPKSTYTPKRNTRNVMIIFEFKDNPTDRYILPREAIIEVLKNDIVLVSFLAVHNRNWKGEPKKIKKEETPQATPTQDKAVKESVPTEQRSSQQPADQQDQQTSQQPAGQQASQQPADRQTSQQSANQTSQQPANQSSSEQPVKSGQEPPATTKKPSKPKEKPIYSAITMSMINVPKKSISVIERSVTKQEITRERMKEILDFGIRADDYKVWYEIEKEDTELLESLQTSARPPTNMVIPSRKREYKARKKEEGSAPKRPRKKPTDTPETTQQPTTKTEEGMPSTTTTVTAEPNSTAAANPSAQPTDHNPTNPGSQPANPPPANLEAQPTRNPEVNSTDSSAKPQAEQPASELVKPTTDEPKASEQESTSNDRPSDNQDADVAMENNTPPTTN